jgi:hypothetical protein
VAERQHLDRDADLDPPRAGREGGRHDERRGEHGTILLEVDLGEPDGVEADSSAAFICARDSSKAVARLMPAGDSNSVNRPNSMLSSREE